MLTEAASQMTTDGRLIMKLRKCGLIELEISARGRPVLTGLFDPR